MEQLLAPITSTEQICSGVYLLWAHAPQIAREATPGQFVMVRCSDSYTPLLRRPLSVHRVHKDQIALLFQVVGQGTDWLAHQPKDKEISLLGPLGRGFHVNPDSQRLLLIAGGIGIAPLMFLAEKNLNLVRSVTIALGANTADELYPKTRFPRKAKVLLVTEDGSQGEKGLVTDVAQRLVGQADQVYACGPTAMYRSLSACPEFRDKRVQVSLEVMMGCGVGACYGCSLKTTSGSAQVCKDGPVFELSDMLWD